MPADVAQFRLGLGLPNAVPKIGPIIINEIMYHPPDVPGSPPVDNEADEFIELHNITTSPQSIAGWKLKGDSDYTFNAGTTILPGDYVIVVSFNPATNATMLNAFRAKYGLTAATAIYGPFTPKLANDTQNVELAYPGPPVAGDTPYILVDKVEYLDVAPWSTTADGGGHSLQRISRTAIGNDPGNWTSATPSPGNVNYGQLAIEDSDGDGLPDAWEIANGFDKFSATDAVADYDGDGQSNVAEYLAGTDLRSTSSVLRASITKVANGFQIQFVAMPNKNYTVFYANTLGEAWIELTDVAAQPSQAQQTITDSTVVSQRFYKVVTPQQ